MHQLFPAYFFFFKIGFIIFSILTIAAAAAAPVQHCNPVLPFIVELII